MQTMIFDDNIDRSGLPQRDQLAWIRLRDRQNLKDILGMLELTGYMAMAQAAEMYGGSPANARREIRERLVVPGLVGQAELNGNAYLHMRAAGARLVTGREDATGVPAVPEKTDRTLTASFARVEWALRVDWPDQWPTVPGVGDPANLDRIAQRIPAEVQEFRESLRHRNGVFCLGISQVTPSRLMAVYVAVDLNRSRSAYRELLQRLQEAADRLYPGTIVRVHVLVDSPQREKALNKVLAGLQLKRPVVPYGAETETDVIFVEDYNLQRYTAYAFHRVKPAVLP